MARVLVTGSTEGLGLMAGQLLQSQGHRVTLHARDAKRAQDARRALPEAEDVLVGDLSSIAETRQVAAQANDAGPYDAVIHNAGIGYPGGPDRRETGDGVELVFAVNVLAPYLLTASIRPPRRLVYLSSGMHRGGVPNLDDPQWKRRRWNGVQAYSDSKLLDVVLAFAVARCWTNVLSNALEPGWVATRMGGPSAPDDLAQGAVTQAWLAVSDSPEAAVSGEYFYHRARRPVHPAARDPRLQDELLAHCESLSGVKLPPSA